MADENKSDESKVTGLTDPLHGKKFADQWHIVEMIARGGTATVYRGRDEHTGNRVAIKVLHPHLAGDPKMVKRFLREVGAVSQIESQHVGKIYDWGRADDDGVIFIISELLSGETLEQAIGDPPCPMPFDRTRKIGLGILKALIAAHEQGIVHRDLKPANVFLVKDAVTTDFVKVIDFGIAKVKGDSKLTADDQAIGTPLYMSPEQSGGRPVGPQTDLYALGVILYEMTTGRVPFPDVDDEGNERSFQAVLCDHVDPNKVAPPPHLYRPDIPPELELVIMRALMKKLDERFQTAAEFYLDLAKSVTADPDEDSQRVSRVALEQRTNPHFAARAPRLLPKYDDGPAPARRATPPDPGDSTPTHIKGSEGAPSSGALGRAKTITPTQLAAEEAVMKAHEVWTGKGVTKSLLAVLIFVAALGLTFVFLPAHSNSEETNATDGASADQPADAAEVADETGARRDVLIVEVPVFVPMPPGRDAETEAPEDAGTEDEAEATEEVAEANAPDAEAEDAGEVEATEEVAASPPTPPAGYEEHLAAGEAARRARKWRQAADEFRTATELWTEGAAAWRGLGDALLSLFKRDEGEAAIRRYLELAPNAADAPYFRSLIGE